LRGLKAKNADKSGSLQPNFDAETELHPRKSVLIRVERLCSSLMPESKKER